MNTLPHGCVGRCLLVVGLAWAADVAVPVNAKAAEPTPPVRLLRSLPRTEAEVARAHEQHRGLACETLPANTLLEQRSFLLEAANPLDALDDARRRNSELPVPTSRRAILSVGTDMTRPDQQQLPALSRGQILDYLQGHYVTVQARVQRDLIDGELYLHHRPYAGVGLFRGPRFTEDGNELILESIQNIRSLGVYLKPGARATPQALRTLVLVHKNMVVAPAVTTAAPQASPAFELVFLHARPAARAKPTTASKVTDELELHTIVTSQHRTRWNYLEPYQTPTRPADCSICATVYFTDYKVANLIPAATVTRRVTVRSRTGFEREALDRYAREQSWQGDALDNLTETLDAIIDGNVPSSRELPN